MEERNAGDKKYKQVGWRGGKMEKVREVRVRRVKTDRLESEEK